MAPAATQSGTVDTGDIRGVPFGPRKGIPGELRDYIKGTPVETVPTEGPSNIRWKLLSLTIIVECDMQPMATQ